MTLGETASYVRSKNAGPFWMTIDIFCCSEAAYRQIKAAESDITTLGINGYLQEDVLVASENTKASGTVVYAGEIYQYMFDEKVVAILQKITTLPQIVWVQ